jgi:hypothetical protein
MFDLLKQVLGKAYQPAAVLLFVLFSAISLVALGETTLTRRIDDRIGVAQSVLKVENQAAHERLGNDLVRHEEQLRLLQKNLDSINMSLVEIKTDVKYLRERK